MIYQKKNDAITSAMDACYDPETGELVKTEEEMFAEINRICDSFDDTVDTVACEVKNLDAEAAAIAEEIRSLMQRKKVCENKRDRAKRLLAFLLDGEKWRNARHNISFRRSESVVLDDGFLQWAETYAPGLLNFKEPEPRKADIKNALNNGRMIEFAHLETKNNIQIK